MQRTEYLVDLLAEAAIDSPSDNYVDLEKMILAREVETAIFQHPTSTISFPPIVIGKNALLSFSCGIKQAAWPYIKSPVQFSISFETETGRQKVFTAKLDPRRNRAHRGWQRHKIDLSRYEGASLRIILQTTVGWWRSTEYAWAGWANPRIEHEVARREMPPRKDRHPHVFLITADALSARYLACYGHPTVQTPALDQLAREGVLCEQAWSQSCTTFTSYVSILTGLHPHEHGVAFDWQPFPPAQANLPCTLAATGYHTLFSASSRELSSRHTHLDRIFAEVVPTHSNPMQEGAITTRQLMRRFDQRPDQPCFCWLHYFDVHPPTMPPSPFNSMYYSGDPTDPERAYLPEEISRIRAVESALMFSAALPSLERGKPVAEIIDILEGTAAVLKDESNQAPDLAYHLLSLGARAMLGQSPREFGAWLSKHAAEMAEGWVPRDLLNWMNDVITLLARVEGDIMSWLADVVDFRYPLSMYLSAVSYFDAQVGALMAYLKEQNLYEQSLMIVTAPHGEILQDEALPYDHLFLVPDTLQVPLILKPPLNADLEATGIRVDGVFDLIDLFPTVLEILRIDNLPNVSGVSRWNQIKSGKSLPAHDSFATGLHQLAQSVFRPPYLLAQDQTDTEKIGLHTAVLGAREILYDVQSGRVYSSEFPEAVKDLRRRVASYAALGQRIEESP